MSNFIIVYDNVNSSVAANALGFTAHLGEWENIEHLNKRNSSQWCNNTVVRVHYKTIVVCPHELIHVLLSVIIPPVQNRCFSTVLPFKETEQRSWNLIALQLQQMSWNSFQGTLKSDEHGWDTLVVAVVCPSPSVFFTFLSPGNTFPFRLCVTCNLSVVG